MNSNRSQRAKHLRGKGKVGGSENDSNKAEMTFKNSKGRKKRPATNKGRSGGVHKAVDNSKHRR